MRPAFGYVQARVQARYADLPTTATFQRLEPVRDLGAYLSEGRAGPLGNWLIGLKPYSGADQIEERITEDLDQAILEVVDWMRPSWRPAARWPRCLIELPRMIQRLRAGQPALAEDQDMAAEPRELAEAVEQADDLLPTWLAMWRQRWPRRSHYAARGLNALTDLVSEHLRRFAALDPTAAWQARADFEVAVRLFFRRHPLQPAHALAYQVLVSLQLERLRAALLRRALFGKHGGGS